MTPPSLQICSSWFMHEKEKITISSVSLSPNETQIIQRHLPFNLSDNRFSHVFYNNCLNFLIQFGCELLVLHSFVFWGFGLFFFPHLPSGQQGRTKIVQTQLWCRFLTWRANRRWQPRKQSGETLGYHGITGNSRKSCVNMDFQMTKDCCERFCCESK